LWPPETFTTNSAFYPIGWGATVNDATQAALDIINTQATAAGTNVKTSFEAVLLTVNSIAPYTLVEAGAGTVPKGTDGSLKFTVTITSIDAPTTDVTQTGVLTLTIYAIDKSATVSGLASMLETAFDGITGDSVRVTDDGIWGAAVPEDYLADVVTNWAYTLNPSKGAVTVTAIDADYAAATTGGSVANNIAGTDGTYKFTFNVSDDAVEVTTKALTTTIVAIYGAASAAAVISEAAATVSNAGVSSGGAMNPLTSEEAIGKIINDIDGLESELNIGDLKLVIAPYVSGGANYTTTGDAVDGALEDISYDLNEHRAVLLIVVTATESGIRINDDVIYEMVLIVIKADPTDITNPVCDVVNYIMNDGTLTTNPTLAGTFRGTINDDDD